MPLITPPGHGSSVELLHQRCYVAKVDMDVVVIDFFLIVDALIKSELYFHEFIQNSTQYKVVFCIKSWKYNMFLIKASTIRKKLYLSVLQQKPLLYNSMKERRKKEFSIQNQNQNIKFIEYHITQNVYENVTHTVSSEYSK